MWGWAATRFPNASQTQAHALADARTIAHNHKKPAQPRELPLLRVDPKKSPLSLRERVGVRASERRNRLRNPAAIRATLTPDPSRAEHVKGDYGIVSKSAHAFRSPVRANLVPTWRADQRRFPQWRAPGPSLHKVAGDCPEAGNGSQWGRRSI